MKHFRYDRKVDIFASRINKHLPRFFSFRPDPEAELVNAFPTDWNSLEFYCFPPFAYIGKILQKIIYDHGTGLIIVPNWPNQYWFTMLQDLLIANPYILPPSSDLLYLPNDPLISHPLCRNLELMACLVSERAWRDTNYPVIH